MTKHQTGSVSRDGTVWLDGKGIGRVSKFEGQWEWAMSNSKIMRGGFRTQSAAVIDLMGVVRDARNARAVVR